MRILNTALGAELEAIAAYQLGAESKLLQAGVLDRALAFQGHHKEHADPLAKTVAKLGGQPVAAKAKYSFSVEQLKSQADVLKFAAGLERRAVSAYLGAVPLFGNRDLARAAARLGACSSPAPGRGASAWRSVAGAGHFGAPALTPWPACCPAPVGCPGPERPCGRHPA